MGDERPGRRADGKVGGRRPRREEYIKKAGPAPAACGSSVEAAAVGGLEGGAVFEQDGPGLAEAAERDEGMEQGVDGREDQIGLPLPVEEPDPLPEEPHRLLSPAGVHGGGSPADQGMAGAFRSVGAPGLLGCQQPRRELLVTAPLLKEASRLGQGRPGDRRVLRLPLRLAQLQPGTALEVPHLAEAVAPHGKAAGPFHGGTGEAHRGDPSDRRGRRGWTAAGADLAAPRQQRFEAGKPAQGRAGRDGERCQPPAR
jgi:hypothetical protein